VQRYGKHTVFELGVNPDSVNVQGNVKAAHEFTIMPLDAMIVFTGPSSLQIYSTHPLVHLFSLRSAKSLSAFWLQSG
jgi:hypothetical protein